MAMIELKGVTKRYGNRTVLDKLNLSVNEGEYVAVMGASGSGKSTLLNIIGLLENFNEGELVLDGELNVHVNSSRANRILREKISYLFQNFALVDDETVQYNLDLALKYVKGTKKEKKEMISAALERVGLKGFERNKIYELSGGEQQRTALARILLKPSKIVLADEPTGSLDNKNRDAILGLLKELNEQGKTIMLVTHDNYVAAQCGRIVNLDRENAAI